MDNMKILVCGDICTRANKEIVDAAFSRELLRDMKPVLEKADFRVANLECVLCDEGVGAPIVKSGPNLFGARKNIEFLTEAGIDAAVLANNHFGDYGAPAIESTLDVLAQNGIAKLGGGMNLEEAYRAWYAEKNGLKVAFLAVCENEFGTAGENTPGAAGFHLKHLADRIGEEKENADFVVVIFHGGNEFDPVPSPVAIDRYRLLIDLGADALIAMHTHCMQGYETYKGKPIVYSLGNWFFKYRLGGKANNTAWNNGYMAQLEFEKGKAPSLSVIPYGLWEDGTWLHVLDGEEKEKVLAYLDKLNAIIQSPAEVERYYHAWCVISGLNYAKAIVYQEQYEAANLSDETRQQLAPLKNLFGCEAHNHLMRTLLQLEYDGKLEKARAAVAELQALQNMPY